MPYRKIEFRAGNYYHLYNRGNDRQKIFRERENYLFFLRRARKYFTDRVEVIAYCLMPNHYHFLVHLLTDDLSASMHRLALSYSKAFNTRFDRAGSLFAGPFGARLVLNTEYLVHLSSYIHLNPVAAGLVAQAEHWEFSSYREYVGLRHGTLPAPDIVLSSFTSQVDYKSFVETNAERDAGIIEHLMLD